MKLMETNTIKKNNTKYYVLFILSMLIFGSIGIIRRFINLDSSFIAFVRGIIGSLFLLVIFILKKEKVDNIKKKDVFLLVLSGALIGINWMFLFESYNYTSIPKSTLSYYMEPTFVILLSPIFLKTKLTIKKVVCVFASIIGIILVSGIIEDSKLDINDLKGMLYGLSAGALYAFVVIINKKITLDNNLFKTIIQLLSASIIMIPYLLITNKLSNIQFTKESIFLLIVLGIIYTGIAYMLFFIGISKLSSETVALISYIDPISALIFSFIILNESLSLLGLIESILIIGILIFNEIKIKK